MSPLFIFQFTQCRHLWLQLKKTAGTILVEGSLHDRRWGIGLDVKDPMAQDEMHWQGDNLLGHILTDVRDELLEDDF